MNRRHFRSFRSWALTGAAVAAIASPAYAEEARRFEIPQQSLIAALEAFGKQGDKEILFSRSAAEGRATGGVVGEYEPAQALSMLLDGSGLRYRQVNANTYVIEVVQDPQGGSAAAGGAEVEALIVTAQKREENIQDVPIAISAFSQKSLDEQKIEGGFDLVKAIPNVSFSKNNFTSYNFSIRGVGTKAVSATTDPGVAVAFNNTAIIQNRLFEQEYFDLERVEVLRGPQGTLFGRNATSGVINVISAKPNLHEFDGWMKGEVGNYKTKRLSAMVNVPIIENKLAVRLAGALTDREGYDYNTVTKNPVNGRDLWSARLTVGFEPFESFRGNFIWERFSEDDNRSRTGKQLCKRDEGPAFIGGVSVEDTYSFGLIPVEVRRAMFSQGCSPVNLYSDEAFGTPNGLAIPTINALATVIFEIGTLNGKNVSLIQPVDPYRGLMQSRNLREIASVRDPIYRAGADLFELNLEYDLTASLTAYSQTAYVEDETYSFQDFNRFNSFPVFNDTSQVTPGPYGDWSDVAPGGIFCDPQIGCSDTIAGFDIASATGKQFSQEFRLQSSYEGPFNFSLGANYTKFETLVDYYVFYNVLTAAAMTPPFTWPGVAGDPTAKVDISTCAFAAYLGFTAPETVPTTDPDSFCIYIDPNPIESINGEGHNYFRSKNPYELESWAGFGEAYWNISENLKMTLGLRYTVDQKTTIPVPTQALLAKNGFAGGYVSSGYPELAPIEQEWGEWTGRIGFDWKPVLPFTNETMLYAFYSRGYKGGGANPPRPGFATRDQINAILMEQGFDPFLIQFFDDQDGDNFGCDEDETFSNGTCDPDPEEDSFWPALKLTAVEYGDTFDAEFVDAFEVGTKNSLFDGGMKLNITGFFYDYKNYQVSQIRDRTAVNENFDAKTWGIEFETVFAPSRDFQILANFGYLDTEIAEGESSIDIMNRTQGNPNYVVVKPWLQLPSNCVVPAHYIAHWLSVTSNFGGRPFLCGGVKGVMLFASSPAPNDPLFPSGPYDPANYPEINGGAGIRDQLGGNELPNAPHWTANIGMQHGLDIGDSWRATLRGDVYWQSQSWARVYNADPYDKLHGWYNMNMSLALERPDEGLKIELYAKNIFNDTPITDAFLNSDDTALTTNVFVLDPRLIGLSIRKEF